MERRSRLFIQWALVIGAVVAVVFVPLGGAYGSGVDGYSQKGATCHSSSPDANGDVAISWTGPSSVTSGTTASYTVAVSGGPPGTTGGFDLSVTAGTLIPGPNTQLQNGELTHIARDARSWSFQWTAPSTAGTATMYVAAMASDGSGKGGDSWDLSIFMVTVVLPSDTQDPTVSITSPSTGATISGTIAIQMTASDNVGVMRVELRIDGTLLGTDTSAPYTFAWDTTTVTNGPHELQATAYDAAGNSGVASQTNSVQNQDTTPPVANAGPDLQVPPGTSVTLDGSGSSDNVGIVNWTWSFTDGGPVLLYGEIASYRFQTVGDYAADLTVRDAAGLTDTDRLWVNVTSDNSPPIARLCGNHTVLLGMTVEFDATNSSDDVGIKTYRWDILDQLPETFFGPRLAYAFSAVGNWTVRLTVIDYADKSDAAQGWADVLPDVEAPVAAVPSSAVEVTVGSAVTFDGRGSTDNVAVRNWTWSFTENGTGRVLYGALLEYAFAAPGNYTVTLIVFDLAGNADATSFVVRVLPVAPPGDSDADGLPDAWEVQYFGGLLQNATGDPDSDGLPNLQEYLGGTHPLIPNVAPEPPPEPSSMLEVALSAAGLFVLVAGLAWGISGLKSARQRRKDKP